MCDTGDRGCGRTYIALCRRLTSPASHLFIRGCCAPVTYISTNLFAVNCNSPTTSTATIPINHLPLGHHWDTFTPDFPPPVTSSHPVVSIYSFSYASFVLVLPSSVCVFLFFHYTSVFDQALSSLSSLSIAIPFLGDIKQTVFERIVWACRARPHN